MKKNDLLILAATGLYSYLFYGQTAGINFLLFSVVMIIFFLIKNHFLLFDKAWIFSAAGSILSAIAILLYGNTLSVTANIISLSLMANFSIHKESSLILALLYSLYSYISSIAFMIMGYFGEKVKENTSKNPATTKFFLVLVPVIITVIFFLIYREANPIFKNFTENISLDFITWPWVRFTLLGFVLMYGFFNHRAILYLFHKDLNASDRIHKEQLPEKSFVFGKELSRENENLSGIILFTLLNMLLLLVNTLDIYALVSGVLPEDMSYSEFVHQGVELLILSILVAIAIILFYFRGGLNFYEKNTGLKILAYLWILQNAVLILTIAYKNELYVSEYSLTYKRIGVFVYLFLSLIGLATTFIKILRIKSNWFLFRKNGWAFYVVLLISCFVNWDLLITRFNIQYSKELDKEYLLTLSATTLPDMIRLSQAKSWEHNIYIEKNLHYKTFHFLENWKKAEWQSWNTEDSKIYRQISELEKAEKIIRLNLQQHSISSLSPLSEFKNLKELNLENNHLENLQELAYFPKLRKLNLAGNQLDSLHALPTSDQLSEINISSNAIEDISFLSRLPSLQTLIFTDNNHHAIKEYPELAQLKLLDLSNTMVGNYDVEKYKKLKELRLNKVKKQSLYLLPELPHLEKLEWKNNYISATDAALLESLSKFRNIKKLDLSYNEIAVLKSIAFEGNKIEHLLLSNNALKNLWDIDRFPHLNTLNITYCGLTDISPLNSLSSIENLQLAGNRVSNLSPIADMTGLKKLNLTANRINDIQPLQKLINLEELELDGNSLSDIKTLAYLKNLKVLYLKDNSITDYSPLKELRSLESLRLGYVNDDLIQLLCDMKKLKLLYCSGLSEEQHKKLNQANPGLLIETSYENIYESEVLPANVSSY